MSDPIIGIDLGTSNTAVAIIDANGEPQVIADAAGDKIQPSVVSFHPNGQVLVGAPAKQRRIIDPQNTVYSAKRLIGRTFRSKEVTAAGARVSYALKEGVNEQPVVVTRAGEFAIPEVSAIVLDHARSLARAALGGELTRAVVTVPANFTDAQRSATATAGAIAGISVVRVLNEPTAAALAYGHKRKLDQTIAVYDFGGGTFDVTILRLAGQVYEVLGTAGDSFLGGDDIDECLVEVMVQGFLRERRIDLRDNDVAIQRLRAVAEQTKIQLSRRNRAIVKVDEIAYGPGGAPLDLEIEIHRNQLVERASDLIESTFGVCNEALKIAGVDAAKIDEVVLVGGTTKMPRVRERVSAFFNRQPRTDVNPEEAVAVGAALQAQALERILGGGFARSTARVAVAPPAPPMAQGPRASRTPLGSAQREPARAATPAASSGEPAGRPAAEAPREPRGLRDELELPAGHPLPDLRAPSELSIPTESSTERRPRPGYASDVFGQPLVATPPGTPMARLTRPRGAVTPARAAGAAGVAKRSAALDAGPPHANRPAPSAQALPAPSFKAPSVPTTAARSARSTLLAAAPAPIPPRPPAGADYEPGDAAGTDAATRIRAPLEDTAVDDTDLDVLDLLDDDTFASESPLLGPAEQAASADNHGRGALWATSGRSAGAERSDSAEPAEAGFPARYDDSRAERVQLRPSTDDDSLIFELEVADGTEDEAASQATDQFDRAPEPSGLDSTTNPFHARAGHHDVGGPAANIETGIPGEPVRGPERLAASASLPSIAAPVTAVPGAAHPWPAPLLDLAAPAKPNLDARPLAARSAAIPPYPAHEPRNGRAPAPPAFPDLGAPVHGHLEPSVSAKPRPELPSARMPAEAHLDRPPTRVPPSVPQPRDRDLSDSEASAAQTATGPHPDLSDLLPAKRPQRATTMGLAVSQPPSHPPQLVPGLPTVVDVNPHGLGIATVAGFCEELIARNARLPVERKRVFSTSRDRQDVVRIRVCQGESRRLVDNLVLGDLILEGLPAAPRGHAKIEVTFQIDAGGLLHVRARDSSTGLEQEARLAIAGAQSAEEVAASRDRIAALRRR